MTANSTNSEEMQIFSLTYDLLRWLLPRTERFPKEQRFVLTKRLQDSALDFYETIHVANAQMGRTREGHLRTADAHLNKLRAYLRLVHEWGWLKCWPVCPRQQDGDGDRQAAGWMDQTNGEEPVNGNPWR
ncbi:MAG: four helix bundle protein [Anaerolineae bacterium]